MQGLRIKNVKALEIIGAPVVNETMTTRIADLMDRLHEARVNYDHDVWGPEGSRSTDSAVIEQLILNEIAHYERKIKARDTEEIRAIIVGS